MPSSGPTSTLPRRRISRSTIIGEENHELSLRSTKVMLDALLRLLRHRLFGIDRPSAACEERGVDGQSGGAAEHAAAGKESRFAKAFLDADQLVVFGKAIGTRERAGLDLAAIGRDREVGNC